MDKKEIENLLELKKVIAETNYLETYLALTKQRDAFIRDINDNDFRLSSDGADKIFERIDRIFLNLPEYEKTIGFYRQQLTKEELQEAKKQSTTLYDEAFKTILDGAKI